MDNNIPAEIAKAAPWYMYWSDSANTVPIVTIANREYLIGVNNLFI